jgi:hypothetical protein
MPCGRNRWLSTCASEADDMEYSLVVGDLVFVEDVATIFGRGIRIAEERDA